ncbi:MAG: AMP nucleosidase [Fibrobacteria bacterium]|nr:AMP nucleosidase [Fibrobacteria bacterium]
MAAQITEEKIARDTLERYSGSDFDLFQPQILLTNFPHYVDHFSNLCASPVYEGSLMKACHWKKRGISILDYKVGSPAAALAIDLLSFVNPRACLMLGMCGGLRKRYKIGDYLLPVAAIRGEGTSDFYLPPNVPAMSNFTIQKELSEVMEAENKTCHVGITHSTNIRFWEFNQEFRSQLLAEKVQAIEMECATLFAAGYKRKVSVGALLLISDKPLKPKGIKTKESSKRLAQQFTSEHIDLGIKVLSSVRDKRSGLFYKMRNAL